MRSQFVNPARIHDALWTSQAFAFGSRVPKSRFHAFQDPVSIRRILKDPGLKAGIGKVFPYMLRPSYATHLLKGGAHLRAIQDLLGHFDVSTAAIIRPETITAERTVHRQTKRRCVDRERQIGEITAKLLESRPDSLRTKLRNIRSFVVFRMQNLRAILNSDVAHVRAKLAKRIGRRDLPRFRDLEFCGAWQYRWCRGPG